MAKWKVRRRTTYTIWYYRKGRNYAILWESDISVPSARDTTKRYSYVKWGRHSAGSWTPKDQPHLLALSKRACEMLVNGKADKRMFR